MPEERTGHIDLLTGLASDAGDAEAAAAAAGLWASLRAAWVGHHRIDLGPDPPEFVVRVSFQGGGPGGGEFEDLVTVPAACVWSATGLMDQPCRADDGRQLDILRRFVSDVAACPLLGEGKWGVEGAGEGAAPGLRQLRMAPGN